MAVTSERVAVGGTAVALNPAGPGVHLTLRTDVEVDLGPAGVTSGGGLSLLDTDAPLSVQVDPGDVLFAISTATSSVQVLRT